jgi:hypothetical protein
MHCIVFRLFQRILYKELFRITCPSIENTSFWRTHRKRFSLSHFHRKMLTYKFSGTPCICSLERRRKCHARLLKVHHRLNFLKLYFISVYTSNAISGPKYLWILEFNKTDFLTHFEWLRSMFGKKLSFHWHTHTHTHIYVPTFLLEDVYRVV